MEMEMQAEAGEVALEGEVMAEQTFSPRAQLDPRTVEISAPRGQLGLVFDRGSTTLAKIKGSSPLSNLVQVGWTLVAVNDVDVSDMDGWALTKLLQERAQEARRLLFQKPGQEEPEPVVYGEVMPATPASPDEKARFGFWAASMAASAGARAQRSVRALKRASVEAPPTPTQPVVASDVMARGKATAGGKVEFAGVWKSAMSQKMAHATYGNDEWGNAFQVRRAFAYLVADLVRTGTSSGIIAVSKTQMPMFYVATMMPVTYKVSWSADSDDECYKKKGLVGMDPDQIPGFTGSTGEGIRFDGFDGAIDVVGGESQAAVYRVTLPDGGFDQSAIAALIPRLPEDQLYSGPRSDNLLSTDDISGDYGPGASICCCIPMMPMQASRCGSMTVVPHGPDMVEVFWSDCGLGASGGILPRSTLPRSGENSFLSFKFVRNGMVSRGGLAEDCPCCCPPDWSKKPTPTKIAFEKVEPKDMEGVWKGYFLPPAWFCPPHCLLVRSVTSTKKAIDQDRYEETGVGTCVLPIQGCDNTFTTMRTRLYVNGHPTNGFAEEGGGGIEWFRDSTYEGTAGFYFAKKIISE